MTTPSQNVNDPLFRVAEEKRTRHNQNGTSDEYFTLWGNRQSGHKRLIRPTSGTSPVRPDGTRAPRAWNSSWAKFTQPRWNFTFQHSYPWATWFDSYELKSTVSQWGSLYLMCTLSGASYTYEGYGFPVNALNGATTNLLNKIGGEKAQLGVALAEARKTGQYIGQASTEIVDLVEKMLRSFPRNRADVVRALRTSPQKLKKWAKAPGRTATQRALVRKFLEWNFAIKPTLSDINDAATALDDYLFEQEVDSTLTVRAGFTQELETPVIGTVNCSMGVAARGRLNVIRKDSCHFSCVYAVTPVLGRRLNQLGFANPAAVVWERTPFSWVVDYVLGVGDWFTSMYALEGTTFKEGSRSTIQRLYTLGDIDWTYEEGITAPRGFPTVYRWPLDNIGRFDRVVLDQSPRPAFVPTYRNKIGVQQTALTLSALSQVAYSMQLRV